MVVMSPTKFDKLGLVKLGLLNFDQNNIVYNCNKFLLDFVISNNKYNKFVYFAYFL